MSNFSKLVYSVSHVHITCGQPDVINYTAAEYWWKTCPYNCYGLPSTVIVHL